MPLDRESIERPDLPRARRGGYEPEAVDAHLRAVADEVQLLRRAAEAPAVDPLAAAASHQVRAIVAAAEHSAEELRQEAAAKAREHVERVAVRGQALFARIEAVQRELDAVMEGVRAGAGRLAAEVAELDRVAATPAGITPPPASEGRSRAPSGRFVPASRAEGEATAPQATPAGAGGAVAAGGTSVAADVDGVAGAAHVDAPADPTLAEPEDAGARLVALEMALEGTPREATERYLAEHYALPAPAALVDEIYAHAGR